MRQVRNQTLKFCGIPSVRTTRFPSVRSADDRTRARWLAGVEDLARREAGAKVPVRA
ncbi:hypothetical protein [Microbacterium testaceum]|uniref:hypothetical protein n=1 Tax=Microbacterium testaceum TaxID=2033 RepID=UPI000AB04466|nr:hypothetical protein [Microbacterium testaceum]